MNRTRFLWLKQPDSGTIVPFRAGLRVLAAPGGRIVNFTSSHWYYTKFCLFFNKNFDSKKNKRLTTN
jgi:hypothetical protein